MRFIKVFIFTALTITGLIGWGGLIVWLFTCYIAWDIVVPEIVKLTNEELRIISVGYSIFIFIIAFIFYSKENDGIL